jgi:tripartite-type tricarboxylate transporter receptor subunit TctC
LLIVSIRWRIFTPITALATVPTDFVVDTRVPAQTLDEFVKLAKSQRGEPSLGSAGHGSKYHVSMPRSPNAPASIYCMCYVSRLSLVVMAQDTTYPSTPVRLIPPAAPGGNPDGLAGLLAHKLSGVREIICRREPAGCRRYSRSQDGAASAA